MAQRVDRREEGLRELAGMIAKAYRRRMTGESSEPPTDAKTSEEDSIDENEIMTRLSAADSYPEYVYKETVKVENFIRKKVNRVGK